MPRGKNLIDSPTRLAVRQALTVRKVGKTWQQLEKEIGYDCAFLSRVAAGKQPPSEGLAEALGVPVIRHELVAVCPKCKHLHEQVQSCRPKKIKRPGRALHDLSAKRIRKLFQERQVLQTGEI